MIKAQDTFGKAAYSGIGTNAFRMAANDIKMLGNFPLEDSAPSPIQTLVNKL